MIDKLKKSLNDASGAVKDQVNTLTEQVSDQITTLTDSVKERANAIIEDWITIFPNLESYGLKIMSFGLKMGINPTLEVELQGNARSFSPEKIDAALADCQGNKALTTVFKTIKTTYDWHARTGANYHFKSIFLKISVSITPEIMVYLGEPKLM
jgi:hypothetical protein